MEMTSVTNPGIGAYRIEPLSGPENYVNWSVLMKVILTDMKLWGHTSGVIPRPVTTTPPATRTVASAPATTEGETVSPPQATAAATVTADGSDEATEQWDRKDQQALGAIQLRLRPSMLHHVIWSTTSKEAWDTLKENFNNASVWNATVLRRQFNRFTFKEGQPMEEQLRDLRKIYDQLRMMGDVIPDKQFASHIIQALPGSWDNFASSFLATIGEEIKSVEVISRIRLEEARRNGTEDQGSGNAALITTRNRSRFRAGIRCHKCGKEGHFAWECRSERQRPTGGQQSGGRNSRRGNRGGGRGGGTRAEVVYEFVTRENSFRVEGNSWLADTGSQSHIVRNRNLFVTYHETPGRRS